MARKFLVLITLIALSLTGCGSVSTPIVHPMPASTSASFTETPVAASESMTLIDGLGRTVTLPGPAQRVVSMAPSNTEILFAVGAGSQVVGRDQLSDYPGAVQAITDIGSTFDALDTETIVSLKPDLILAAEINTSAQVKSLTDLGLTVYYLKNPTTLDGMYANMQIVAKLTGHDSEADAAIQQLKARVAAVDAKVASVTDRPTVFYELDSTDPAKPYTAGKGTFLTLLLERAGGRNIAGNIDGYPQLSLEQVVAADPDFIILGDSAYGATPESMASRPGWGNLRAVQDHQVYPFDDNLASRPGPRLVDGLEQLAKLLHPELFQ